MEENNMSLALCFNCGEIKFGALCECEKCGITSTENIDLDILFSDWNMSENTMKKFGSVIKTINSKVDDKDIHQWLFLVFITLHYPELFKIEILDENIKTATELFKALDITRFELK